jgi:glucose-6-phosphate 1-dehydrogenase
MIERMVVFGASGDLTRRLLMPAVAELAEAGLLPPGMTILGCASTDRSTEDFREHISAGLAEHAAVSPAGRDAVVRMLQFRAADVTSAEDVRGAIGADHGDTLVYLALPPSLLDRALTALAATGLGASDAVAIEKPFGTGLDSARHLNEILRVRLPQPTIFRVDHFLSNELVHRIIALRFLNRIFESVWNAGHVERVEVSWLESLALEGRAGYYDRAGALKDMIQNHLMEVMALVLMEPPARLDATSFRSLRVEALRCVATPTPDSMPERSVRARYTAGTVGQRRVPSYVDEPGVDPGRGTETYAALTVDIDHPRWTGTPFTLRSGKAMATDSAEVALHFRPLPDYVVRRWPGIGSNVLRLGLTEPYVRLGATLNGPGRSAVAADLEARSAGPRFGAYAHLLRQMLDRDPMLFIRGDEAEEAWRIIDPVVQTWSAGTVPLQDYAAGSAPPGPPR